MRGSIPFSIGGGGGGFGGCGGLSAKPSHAAALLSPPPTPWVPVCCRLVYGFVDSVVGRLISCDNLSVYPGGPARNAPGKPSELFRVLPASTFSCPTRSDGGRPSELQAFSVSGAVGSVGVAGYGRGFRSIPEVAPGGDMTGFRETITATKEGIEGSRKGWIEEEVEQEKAVPWS